MWGTDPEREFLEIAGGKGRKLPGTDRPIVVFCNTSNRSILGASLLKQRGFTNVIHVAGGFTGWKNAGYPLIEE